MGYLLPKVYGDKVWTGSEDDEALMKFIKDPWERGLVHPPSLPPPEFPHPYLAKDKTTHTMGINIHGVCLCVCLCVCVCVHVIYI